MRQTPAFAWSCLTPTATAAGLRQRTATVSPLASLLLRRSLHSPATRQSLLKPVALRGPIPASILAATCRAFSLRSIFPTTPAKTLDNLADEADDAPTSIDSQLKYYSTYLALPAASKTSSDVAKRVIERYEVQTKLWTSSSAVQGKESTLLRSAPAWDAYLTALTNWSHPNVPSAGERVASASQRRDAVLAGTAASIPVQPVANAQPELTNEQLVSAVITDKSGTGSTARVIDQPSANATMGAAAASSGGGGYRGYSSSAGAESVKKNEPIRVIVEEARGSLVLKMVRFLLTVAIYAFVVCSSSTYTSKYAC